MHLQEFYNLADTMKAHLVTRNESLGIQKTNYAVFLDAMDEVAKELVTTGTSDKPYSEANFNTAVDLKTVELGYNPNDLSQREYGVAALVSELSYPAGISNKEQLVALIIVDWAKVIVKNQLGNYSVIEAIPAFSLSSFSGFTSKEGYACLVPTEAQAVQVTLNKKSGVGVAKLEYSVSADDDTYTPYRELGTIANNEAKVFGIDTVNIPRYIKPKISHVSGDEEIVVSTFITADK